MRSLQRRALAASLVILWPASGCGIGLQLGLGWQSETKVRRAETRAVEVRSQPAGAMITRRGANGDEVTLGLAPLSDMHTVVYEETIATPSTAGLWIGFGLEMAAVVALTVASGVQTTESRFEDGLPARDDSNPGLLIAAGLLSLGAATDLLAALIWGLMPEERSAANVVEGRTELVYIARAPGLSDVSARVVVPEQSLAELVLAPPPLAPAPPPEPAPPRAGVDWVVAVMNVEDANADGDRALDRDLVRDLGDQIRVFIAERGVRTVDRSTQQRYLEEQINTLKQESYAECYDDACQVELGKALAASHILRTRVARFGSRCVLNGELIDLRAEVTTAAASSQGACEAEGFLEMGAAVARSLVAAR